jgi:hypothetical protein
MKGSLPCGTPSDFAGNLRAEEREGKMLEETPCVLVHFGLHRAEYSSLSNPWRTSSACDLFAGVPLKAAAEDPFLSPEAAPHAVQASNVTMSANPEYLSVLAQVVTCVRECLRHEQLPDLTAEQLTDWLHSMTVEDVRSVWKESA